MFNSLKRKLSLFLPGLLPNLILTVVGILATLPAFWSGNVIVDDTLNHLVISHHFISQLGVGEWYPRWLGELNNGLGSPVMFFYGPISYYMTGLLHFLVQSNSEGWRELGLSVSLAMVASGFTAYAWLRRFGNDHAALLGAIFYMGAPYHLIIDLYQHFAFAELWGFVWTPLVLLQVHAIAEGCKNAWLKLSVCYALLIMTHLPTTLLFSILPLLYSVFLAESVARRWVLLKVVAGMVIGAGISAIFLIPALFLQPFSQLNLMESGPYYYANNFLYADHAGHAFEDGLRYLSIALGSMLMVSAGVYGLGARILPLRDRYFANFWLLIGIASFLMVLPISKLIWELVLVLQKVQFPHRFGIILTLSMSALLTLWLKGVGELFSRTNRAALVIVVLIGLTQLVPVAKICRSYLGEGKEPSLTRLHEEMTNLNGSFKVLVELARIDGYTFFLPKWADPRLIYAQYGFGDGLDLLRSISSKPDVEAVNPFFKFSHLSLTRMDSRHAVLDVRSSLPLSLRVKQFYFPKWVATVRGEAINLNVYPSPSGLVQLDVPAGNYQIDLVLTASWAERVGQVVSLLSVMLFLACWARLRYPEEEHRNIFRGEAVEGEMAVQKANPTQDRPSLISQDQNTADAFANSWNHLPAGSIYDRQQFEDWLAPLTQTDIRDKRVLELGCGNGSLLVHLAAWSPKAIEGVDLGDSVRSATANMARVEHSDWKITQADMQAFRSEGYDLVYSIGVLHHLKSPKLGLDSVIANVKPGGRFHCWVYAREGNALVIHLVDPLRKIASRLPWWLTKYGLAAPLAVPFYLYAHLVSRLQTWSWGRSLPLFEYCLWIVKRPFRFFWHVAFDQLVTPQTWYLDRHTLESWIASYPEIQQDTTYLLMRNGNSWKFVGVKVQA